jgi:membrane-associated phospholipid phosphatase
VRFRRVDIVLTAVVLAYTAVAALSRPPGWERCASVWILTMAAVLGARYLVERVRWEPLRVVLDLAPVSYILAVYFNLDPLIDLHTTGTHDDWLIAAELRLFGGHVSLWLERFMWAPVTELLFGAYSIYYAVPLSLGLALRLSGRQRDFEFALLAVPLAFLLNYLGYIAVPAIGPRFTLEHAYAGPLQGYALTQYSVEAFRHVPTLRDCFPSGHTGITLLTLVLAWRSLRWLFWVLLPIGVLIVAATIWCRFHYLVDLVAAIPSVGVYLWAATRLANARQFEAFEGRGPSTRPEWA